MKILIVENIDPKDDPWWISYLPPLNNDTLLSMAKIPESSGATPKLLWRLLKLYPSLNNYDAVVTQQDGYATFLFAFLNRILRRKRHIHLVHEFITSERRKSIHSCLKYRFLKFCMSTVDGMNCSSQGEITYYSAALELPDCRFTHIPLSTDPSFLDIPAAPNGDYIITAGRTGRDYRTLIEAADDLPISLYLVASPHNVTGLTIPESVKTFFDISLDRLLKLMAHARFVVIPLEDRLTSIGQSVILQAMALGKALITTDVSAVTDYVKNGQTGILVPPNDPSAMRTAIQSLLENPQLAEQMGRQGKQEVRKHFLPAHTIPRICTVIRQLCDG